MAKTYKNLFSSLYSYENLNLAFEKAKIRKSNKQYVLDFEKNLEQNLKQLQNELINNTYKPKPLKVFTIRDPKTRKISASDFRDRIIHHALINIIQPIFEKTFIYDSCANQKKKGTSLALKRFDFFKRKVSKQGFVLKADIKHYFEEVDQQVLLDIIKRKIKDKQIINLIKIILINHKTKIINKGMPLGNLTSQFFANVYLNTLDYFIKHNLKVKYYIRYVDDFVIFHRSKTYLFYFKQKISDFLKEKLFLSLHEGKSKIFFIAQGITFLGFRIFYYYKRLKKNNRKRILEKIALFKEFLYSYCDKFMKKHIVCSILGLNGYLKQGGIGLYNFRASLNFEFSLLLI
ncbi:MAG: reverse transcriptase domain-containing protein [Candidatus Micrarchaeia archaeon]|jgi:retron-type reverse transcriptase